MRVFVEFLHVGFRITHKRLAQRRRRTEQVQDQPAESAEIANQPHIGIGSELIQSEGRLLKLQVCRPKVSGQRIVEVHAGNGLHLATVAKAKAVAVNRFHSPNIGAAITGQRNAGIIRHYTGHAGHPKQFVTDSLVGELMNFAKHAESFPGIRLGWCNEFQQGLRKISRNELIGHC